MRPALVDGPELVAGDGHGTDNVAEPGGPQRPTGSGVDASEGPVVVADDHARAGDHGEPHGAAGRARDRRLARAGARVEFDEAAVAGAYPQVIAGDAEVGRVNIAEPPAHQVGDDAAARIDPRAALRTEDPQRTAAEREHRDRGPGQDVREARAPSGKRVTRLVSASIRINVVS